MSWESSKALTPLKRDFLERFFAGESPFYLTGGSALGIFYLEHRTSRDLDLFTQEDVDWHRLDRTVREIARTIGAGYRSITVSPTFRRCELLRGGDREIVDFVRETVEQIDVEKRRFGAIRVDTLREILVNKVSTLISRCELKDLVDLYFLAREGFDILAHVPDARRKEGGFDPAMVSFLLSEVKVDAAPEFMIAPLDLADFRVFIRDLQRKMSAAAFPEDPPPERP